MAKLTRVQKRQLDRIKTELEMAVDYLRDSQTWVCFHRDHPPTTTLDFVSHDGETSLTPVAKEYGSKLVGVFSALALVNAMIEGDL
jgi:hypothetical protein